MSALVLICVTLEMSDGDSGRCVTADGERHRVRLAGIDAGEVAPFTRCRQRPNVWACSPEAKASGPAATARARQLAANGARCTVQSRDRYQRIAADLLVSTLKADKAEAERKLSDVEDANAALRAERDQIQSLHHRATDRSRHWEIATINANNRAAEAERKLAEAEQVIREISETAQITRVRHLARTFLSKEAERG